MRRERSSYGSGKYEPTLEEKLAQLRKIGKQKAADLRDRELEKFMTPGQRKRENIRRGKRRAKMEEREDWGE